MLSKKKVHPIAYKPGNRYGTASYQDTMFRRNMIHEQTLVEDVSNSTSGHLFEGLAQSSVDWSVDFLTVIVNQVQVKCRMRSLNLKCRTGICTFDPWLSLLRLPSRELCCRSWSGIAASEAE